MPIYGYFNTNMYLLFGFFTKFRVNLDECRNGEGDGAEEHDKNKEGVIA